MDIKTQLDREILNELENLNKMELGSEEYTKTVDGIAKLVDRSVDLDKFKAELKQQEKEHELKLKQAEDGSRDQLIKNGISLGGTILQLGVTIWGARKSWRFEETGTITTTMGREFMKKLIFRK